MGELATVLSNGVSVESAREEGYILLEPLARQVAIEFVTTGHTLKQVAADLNQPLAAVRKAFNNPLTRAFIADLQAEMAKHKIINAAWVESQLLELWPKFTGEEPVALINAKEGFGYEACKFHPAEVASILKHFGGNEDQKKAGGVTVTINFGEMGVGKRPEVIIEGEKADDPG